MIAVQPQMLCPSCGGDVGAAASRCPRCGHPPVTRPDTGVGDTAETRLATAVPISDADAEATRLGSSVLAQDTGETRLATALPISDADAEATRLGVTARAQDTGETRLATPLPISHGDAEATRLTDPVLAEGTNDDLKRRPPTKSGGVLEPG